ncbi:hypothetical protein BaRGS_00025269, partial [Batillaria attramentaria]
SRVLHTSGMVSEWMTQEKWPNVDLVRNLPISSPEQRRRKKCAGFFLVWIICYPWF